MKLQISVLLCLCLICSLLPQPVLAQDVVQPGDKKLADLWIEMGLNENLVDWFNQNARPDDIARADHVSLVDLLAQIKVGRRLVVFKSVYDAENLLPHIADTLDIIGYNLEHGPANRPDEQADPVGSVRRMRALADSYHKTLALGPDRSYVLSDGAAMAPYVDFFILQVQKVQTEPQTVREFVEPVIYQLRQANPRLKISIQIRTEGDVAALGDLLDALKGQLDGISVLTSPETIPVAQALWQELRRDRSLALAVSTPMPTPSIAPTPALVPPALSSGQPPQSAPYQPFPLWLWRGGWLLVWILGSALLIALLVQRLQTRRTPR